MRFSPGHPLKLAASQRKRLVRLLLKGSMAQGYRTNLWTSARIAEMVEREFEVRYHPDHIDRLMHSLDWTPQKPERRALERDEEEIERWEQEEWPRIKNAARLGAHIVFADESGFLLIPNVVRNWAQRGQTSIHRHRQGRRDKISVSSGISVTPRRCRLGLYYLLFYDNIGQGEVWVFLRELLRHQVIVLLDNSSTHKGAPIKQLLNQHRCLRIEYFPSYAPRLNPDGGV